jgi:D-alanine transaminase
MTEWCWLNGKVLPLNEAAVNVEDRGFQFADGVYEAVRLYDGKPFELGMHMDRLERSCSGIKLTMTISKQSLASEILNLVKHAGVRDGYVYLQMTRGVSPRNHCFPAKLNPTTLFYVRELPPLPKEEYEKAYTLLSVPDERWNRCWIKCIALIENVLAKNAALAAGADEAIFIHQGNVTEGSTSNIFMVSNGTLITPPLGPKILPGVTREVLLKCAKSAGVPVQERQISLDEAQRCDEVFITSSTRELVWASRWDQVFIGDGTCGPMTHRLHNAYRKCVQESLASSPT